MRFQVSTIGRGSARGPVCLLWPGDWDDWFRYETTYFLSFLDADGSETNIGNVKIAQVGMGPGFGANRRADPPPNALRSPNLPTRFQHLSDEFFSLGQDVSYYENLNALGPAIRDEILMAMNDLAVDRDRFQIALKESVTSTSLLRFVPRNTVQGQFRRIAQGGAPLTNYQFTFAAADSSRSARPPSLFTFDVVPESQPPSNIHVLIGRNGVGKTRLLNGMARNLLEYETNVGHFEFEDDSRQSEGFANLVSVSFSAFDSIDPIKAKRSGAIKAHYVGLRRASDADGRMFVPKSPGVLAREFSASVLACLQDERRDRWTQALSLLESDPVFADVGVAELGATGSSVDEEELRDRASLLYREKLSSGHKIVLLTITKLVETVAERSLVLLDEPEAHLHPPLLSAFIRALSDLLINRNAVAIVATHSPVVLQEVPSSCVWIMRRAGRLMAAKRPELETFGEGVGVLTHEVFGLEVTKAGFHTLIDEAVDEEVTFEELTERFDGHLGGEARGIARSLIAQRDRIR